jgi:8-oxo-dGTP pyrophosphatase MutT (NUDIX family)
MSAVSNNKSMAHPAHRRASRILLLDDQDRFLLMLTVSSLLKVPVVQWITPGGGVEPDETHQQGAVRELFEETGLVVTDVGDPVFTIDGRRRFATGEEQTTHSEFFVVRTSAFTPVTDHWMENEFVDILDVRWWTLDELRATTEPYSPEPLITLIETALRP